MSCFTADGQIAGKGILGGMAFDACKVALLYFAALKLRLHQAGKVLRARKHNDACGVGIQAMCGAKLLRTPSRIHQVLQRVAVVSSARMHRQWSWLVNDHNGFVFVQHAKVCVHIRLGLGWLQV